MDHLNKIWNVFNSHLNNSPITIFNHYKILLILIPLLCITCIIIPKLWYICNYLITVVHETGHALAALMVFSKLRGITIHLDHSGETQSISSNFFLFRAWSAWWGYSFPAFAGVSYLMAIYYNKVGIAITLTVIIAVLITLQIRNFIALLTIGATSAILIACWWYLDNNYIALMFYALAWLLLFGGVKSVIELCEIHYKHQGDGSDAQTLRNTVFLPVIFWLATFVIGAIACNIIAFYYCYQLIK